MSAGFNDKLGFSQSVRVSRGGVKRYGTVLVLAWSVFWVTSILQPCCVFSHSANSHAKYVPAELAASDHAHTESSAQEPIVHTDDSDEDCPDASQFDVAPLNLAKPPIRHGEVPGVALAWGVTLSAVIVNTPQPEFFLHDPTPPQRQRIYLRNLRLLI